MKAQTLNFRNVIKISGEDRIKFLQSLITNDVQELDNNIIYAFFLSPQGKYQADLFIYDIGVDEIIIDVPAVRTQELMRKFKLYKLRAKVNIEDISEEYCVVSSPMSLDSAISRADPRHLELGFRTIISQSELKQLNLEQTNYYFDVKYQLGIPDGEIDLIYDKSFPQQYGADYLNSINYEKGCYVGQEVVSRTHYRGVIRKKIFQGICEQVVEQGDILLQNDQPIGKICSSYLNHIICLIDIEKITGANHNGEVMVHLKESSLIVKPSTIYSL